MKIWALRFLPRPAAWMTCRSREILGGKGELSGERFPFPSLSHPKTFDWWGGHADGVRSDVELREAGFPYLIKGNFFTSYSVVIDGNASEIRAARSQGSTMERDELHFSSINTRH